MNPTYDHQAGWIGIRFSTSGGIQIGWYRGTIQRCDTAAGHRIYYGGTGYHLYIESATTADTSVGNCGGYHVADLSPLSLGGAVTYRINYDSASSCWYVYYNYSQQAGNALCGLPSSGAAEVENELLDGSGTAKMPASIFGVSDPSTNQGLRLLSSRGWVPWDSSVKTEDHDWRNVATNDKTVLSAYALWYHLRTYGAA